MTQSDFILAINHYSDCREAINTATTAYRAIEDDIMQYHLNHGGHTGEHFVIDGIELSIDEKETFRWAENDDSGRYNQLEAEIARNAAESKVLYAERAALRKRIEFDHPCMRPLSTELTLKYYGRKNP